MCFIAKSCEYKIACEPIPCYKIMEICVIDGELRLNSQFYPTDKGYCIGEEISAKDLTDEEFTESMKRINDKSKTIGLYGEVVHSYMCKEIDNEYIVEDLTSCIYDPSGIVTVLCEIPKGTIYFENENAGEYASRKLVIKGLN